MNTLYLCIEIEYKDTLRYDRDTIYWNYVFNCYNITQNTTTTKKHLLPNGFKKQKRRLILFERQQKK